MYAWQKVFLRSHKVFPVIVIGFVIITAVNFLNAIEITLKMVIEQLCFRKLRGAYLPILPAAS